MATRSGGTVDCFLLLLLPTLLLTQDDCSHTSKNEANRYYFVRPEGSVETLCPAQPCLTPSQLREHFSECERNNSCQTANTSVVLLPGTYTLDSNHDLFFQPKNAFTLTGYNEACNTDSIATPIAIIDCNGTWISLMFQQIKCLHLRNCIVFTGHDKNVVVDHITFHDSFIRLASITAADQSELDYNYTLGSQSYCLLQKQLADINALAPSNSMLRLRNVSFSSTFHSICAREYGIQLTTIHATGSNLEIADCLFTQSAIAHISLLHSSLQTLGMVRFHNANTAILVKNSTIDLAGTVNFIDNINSAIHAVDTHSTILLAGTVHFTNNTANNGGAVSLVGSSMIIADNAQVVFQNNHARLYGGAIVSSQHVTIKGSVQFINNSANQGGAAIGSEGSVTIAQNAQVVFQGNHAKTFGGAIASSQHFTIAGSVQFINNTASQGGAIDSAGDVTIANKAQVVFQDNHAKTYGGGIASSQHVTISGSVQFINNTANHGSAINCDENVTIANNAQVVFQGNHAKTLGGAIASSRHVTIAGSVQFINNTADYGSAIDCDENVTIANNAQVVFQGNHAKSFGGAVNSIQHVSLAGSVQFINNSAYDGGAIACAENVTIADNAQVYFQDNHAKKQGGAIASKNVAIAGSVQFINNSAYQGGAIDTYVSVTIADNAEVIFLGNDAEDGGAISCIQNVTIAGAVQFINNTAFHSAGAVYSHGSLNIASNAKAIFCGNFGNFSGGALLSMHATTIGGTVQFINNSALQGGAIDSIGSVSISNSAQVVFQGNHVKQLGGAILSSQHVTIAGSVQFINNFASDGGAIDCDGNVTIANNAQVLFYGNTADFAGGAISTLQNVAIGGTVQFLNNSAYQSGAVESKGSVTVAENAQVVFQSNHADGAGGAHGSQHVTITGTVHFINNSALLQGGAAFSNSITITDSAQVNFCDNNAEGDGGAIASSGNVTIEGSVLFINNSASKEGGAIRSDDVTLSDNSQVIFQGNHAKSGGAISSRYFTMAGTVQFINNSAIHGGAIICYDTLTVVANARIVFQDNYAILAGGAVHCSQNTYTTFYIGGIVKFINNFASFGGAIEGNVTTAASAQAFFQGNHADDEGGAIFVGQGQRVVLGGSVEFYNNTASIGGAISILSRQSKLAIDHNAEVIFKSNKAENMGGAIFIASSLIFVNDILNMPGPCQVTFGGNSSAEFINNTAKYGGSAMYGVTLSKLLCESSSSSEYDYLSDVITIIPESYSAVSSDPLRVCICPDTFTPDCLAILPNQSIPHLHYVVYPGQAFTVPAAAVGVNFALTRGSVHVQIFNSKASLGLDSQYLQGVNQTACSLLQYSVLSDEKHVTLVLTVNVKRVPYIPWHIEDEIAAQNSNFFHDQFYLTNLTNLTNPAKYYINNTFATSLTDSVFRLAGYVERPLLDIPVYVSVQLLDCPPGFTLTDQHRCDCDERILINLLTCNINNQTVRRHSTIWINASFSGNTSNGVIIHKHCPFEYCKPEQLHVNLTHPETQCAFDHYGTLCGACKPNFSLALGSSQCLSQCSDKYLSLLLLFIIAGFALVFFIKILNLTVSQGTINGLIFYANIVEANRSVLFPVQYNRMLSFLSVFISWLNLDLGIETCFIKGLDGYWKTWLQFVFPFYIWLIAAGIILVSHYSTRATKIFGDSSVSVLATLFLLSYAKLLRSVIVIFSFATLEYPTNNTVKVWSFDGNIRYFSAGHIALFLFALAIVLLLWLPYTAVLLSAQWLRTQTHRKRLRWLKPFLDAYNGPFKDKHHYWVGVLLVVRGVLFVFFASFFAIENNVNLLLISITSVSIPVYTSITGRLYKKMYLTLLDNLFFLNLAVFGIGTLYIRVVHGNQEALVTTSVGLAFFEFSAITIFHSYQFVILPIRKWHFNVRDNQIIHNNVQLQPLLNSDSSSDDDLLQYMPRNEVTHSEIRLSQLREEAHHPPSPTTSRSVVLPLPPADKINITQGEEILMPLNVNTHRPNNHQSYHSEQVRANQVRYNENTKQILIPFTHDTPRPNICFTNLTDAAANKAAGTPSQSETAAVSLDTPPPPPPPPPPPGTTQQPRYFAAEREERFIDFNAPRETLLEYTQYRLPQERNEPARDSTAERELLSAPHEHPQESSGPRYFAAERQGPIDFTAPRESLLDYTQ